MKYHVRITFRSHQYNINFVSTNTTLKFSPVQDLISGDEGRRLTFCAWLADEFTNNPGSLNGIIWKDENNFSSNRLFHPKNNHYL